MKLKKETMKKKINDILLDFQVDKICIGEAANKIHALKSNLDNGDTVILNGSILKYENGILKLEPNEVQSVSGTKIEITINN